MLIFLSLLLGRVASTVTLVPSISPVQTQLLSVVGQNVNFNLRPFFQSQAQFSFTLGGLPSGTGIKVAAGRLSGQPSAQDASAQQPIAINVTAQTSSGSRASRIFYLSVLKTKPTNDYFVDGVTWVGANANIDLSALFKPLANIAYTANGFPTGTGLTMKGGKISGKATAADGNAKQPLQITVRGTAGGRVVNVLLALTILPGSKPAVATTSSVALSTSAASAASVNLLATLGQQLSQPFADSFTSSGKLSYALTGMPVGSTITMESTTGMMTGSPGEQDADGKQPLRLAFTATALDGTMVAVPLLITVAWQLSGADSVLPLFARAGASIGNIDVTGAFSTSFTKPITYQFTGLPPGSGLTLNKTRGVMSGILSPADQQATQPLRVLISATDATGKSSTLLLAITVVALPRLIPTTALPGATTMRPAGTTARPAVTTAIPAGTTMRPVGTTARPAGTTSRPAGTTSRPAGTTARPAGPTAQPGHSVTALTGANYAIRILAAIGQTVGVDVTSSFASQKQLTYTASGLPDGSGLEVTSAGYIQGAPNDADLLASQPMAITITATAPDSSNASITAYIAVIGDLPQADTMSTLFMQVGAQLSIDISNAFTGLTQPTLSLSGLPTGTGFKVDGSKLVGTPSSADRSAKQPLVGLITGTDSAGHTSTMAVVVVIVPDAGPSAQDVIATVYMLAAVGTAVDRNITRAFTVPFPRSVALAPDNAFPSGTGLHLSPQGILSGNPTTADAAAPQPLSIRFVVTGSDGNKQTGMVYITVIKSMPTANSVQSLFAEQGSSFTFTPDWSGLRAPISYTLTGLPQGSKLQLSNQGILSGDIGVAEAGSVQPIRVLITGTDAAGTKRTIALLLTVVPSIPS